MSKIIGVILLFLFQVVVLNHLDMSVYLYPQVFILILISLPPYVKKSYQMLFAFGLGLMADFFVSTPGLHASACMMLMLFRFGLMGRYDLDEVIANRSWLSFDSIGIEKFSSMAFVLVLFYHLYAFTLESFSALNTSKFLLTVGISTLLSFIIILLVQFMFIKRERA